MQDSVKKLELKTAILKTLNTYAFPKPMHIREISNYLQINPKFGTVLVNDVEDAVKELIEADLAVSNEEGYTGLYGINLVSALKARKEQIARQREKYKFIMNKLKIVSRFSFIEVVGLIEDYKNECNLLVIVKDDSDRVSKRLINIINKFNNQIPINIKHLLRTNDLKLARNLEMAYEMLTLSILINRDNVYERLIQKNLWFSNFFPNYPLEKISMGFKVDNKAQIKTGSFTKFINKIV